MKSRVDRLVLIVVAVSICMSIAGAAIGSDGGRASVFREPDTENPVADPRVPGPAEVMFLDTRAPSNDAQVVTTMMTLEEGVTYRVTVEGTFSIWNAWAWTGFPLCDPEFPPEPQAMFPSAGADGPVGQDADFFFSSLLINGICQGGSPVPSYFPNNFQVCLDGACDFSSPSWHDPGLGLGDYSDYNPEHVYVYWVLGAGHPLSARRPDSPTSDNYGQMQITTQQMSPNEEVQDVIEWIAELPPGAFPANGLSNALANQYKKLFARIDSGDYCGAIEIIDHQIVRRINGIGPPMDAKDWIYDPWRADLYEETMALRDGLHELAGGECA